MTQKTLITRRNAIKLGAGAVAGTLAMPSILRAAPREMVVGCAGGHVGWMEKAVLPLFEAKYDCKIILEGTKSSVNLEKMRSNKDKPYLSVVMMDDPVLILAVEENLIEKLEPGKIANMSAIKGGAVHMDGMWANYQQPWCGIAFNTGAASDVPSWEALWDPAYKGKVIIPSLQNTEGLWTLFFAAHLATGKPLEEAQYDIDAAFGKLAELKDNLLTIYTKMPPSFNLLEQGEASLLAGSFSSIAIPRKLEGAPVDLAAPKEGIGAMPSGIARVLGGPEEELAAAFINEMLGPDLQAAMIKETFALPTNTSVVAGEGVPTDVKAFSPDWAAVSKNRREWIERFDREIAA
ncbi:extracellular solute-binding protein [Breoghania sp. L-A4]|uniref:extracellular solute-binding protein n=1 Tax=Breoghania sp. L-A4 TaxID=2304600 RepID=UPI000E3609EA|nr:extracellular solute-binding protein [Breoghania sp. L-A4]AXS41522.1 extracellular solute-binding protein [Breoghania sp. L-A4]